MENEFDMVVLPEYKKERCKVVKKSFTSYFSGGHQHTVYMLYGIRQNGAKATSMVNREQWERFDVPIEERKPRSKRERKEEHKKKMKLIAFSKETKPSREPGKNKRRAHNEEIEKWLLENNGIDFNSLLDDGLFAKK